MDLQDPRSLQTFAEAALQRTAEELRSVLQNLAQQLDPFPAFMNMSILQAVETEPAGFQDRQRGCVVVCPDGELYELSLEATLQDPEVGGGLEQVNELKRLELPPGEYIPYADGAIRELSRILRERQGA